MRFSRWIAAVALGVAGILLSPVALASDGDGDGIADEVEDATARNLVAGGGEQLFFVRSRSVGATEDDILEVDFIRGEFTVAYARSPAGPPDVSYTLTFREVVEFIDTGGGISGGDIVKEIDIRDNYTGVTGWEGTSDDGEDRFGFSGTTDSGVFEIDAGVSERFAVVGGDLVTPMEVKADLSIRNWTYVNPSGTSLAIKVEIETTDAVAFEETTLDEARGWASRDEAQLNVSSSTGSAFFSWTKTALVDGVERAVRATTLEPASGGFEFYLVYGRGNAVEHDPKLGAESAAFWSILGRPGNPALEPDLTLYVAGLGAVAGVVALTVLVRYRRKKE